MAKLNQNKQRKSRANNRRSERKTRRAGRVLRSGTAFLAVENLESRLLLASDWQNPGNRFDVDDNSSTAFEVVPLDANIVITELNNRNVSDPLDGALPAIGASDAAPENFIDVTGDMLLTPLDALQVINQLNLDFSAASSESFVATSQLATGTEGNDSLVNASPADAVNNPVVATSGDRSLVVWEQFSDANASWAVFAQRFGANGIKIGDAIEVRGGTALSQRFPAVAVNSIGAFAVAWQSETAAGEWDISAKTFTSAGVVVAESVSVSQTEGNQVNPDIAFSADGTFSVVWEGNGAGDHNGIFVREFFLTGSATGDASLVNASTAGRQSRPAIARVSDSAVVMVWDGPNPDSDATGTHAIFAKIDDASSRVPGTVQTIATGNGLADPAVSVATDGSWVVTFSDGNQIQAHRTAVSDGGLALNLTGLEPLGDTLNYEAWVLVNGSPVSAGVFEVNDAGEAVDLDGNPATFNIDPTATEVVISLEPENDTDSSPALTKILGGVFDASGQATLSIDHPAALSTDFSTASGVYLIATPTTAAVNDETSGVWFLDNQGSDPVAGLNLPGLPSGWTYEGWAVIDGQPVSTGRFVSPNGPDDFSGHSGPDAAPPFPGEDFIVNPPEGLTFPTRLLPSGTQDGATLVISVEPVPDNSTAPFALKPLSAQIPNTIGTGTNAPLAAGNLSVSGTATMTTGTGASSTSSSFTVADNVALGGGSSVAHAADGSFAVSYVDGNGMIRVQRYGANANLVGAAAVVNQTTLISSSATSVAAIGSDFVATWQGRGDSNAANTSGVFARSTAAPVAAAFSMSAIANVNLAESDLTQVIDPVIVDGDGVSDSPTFTMTTTAPGATIDASTGRISIPLTESSGPGTYDFLVTATEGTFATSQSFTVSVSEVNGAPVSAAISDASFTAGSMVSYQIPAASDNDLPANPLTYSAGLSDGNDLPDWLTFNAASRTFSGIPAVGDVGTVDVRVTVSDGALTDTDDFALTITAVVGNNPATFPSVDNQSAAVGEAFSFQVPEATDPNGDDLTYAALAEGGLPLPAWLSFNQASRTFSGMPGTEDIGNFGVVVSASDGTQAGFVEFQILVNTTERFSINPIPQVVTSLPQTPITIKRQAILTDLDGQVDAPTYSVSSATLSSVGIDAATGEITMNISAVDGPAFHLVEVTAMEGSFVAKRVFTVTVNP